MHLAHIHRGEVQSWPDCTDTTEMRGLHDTARNVTILKCACRSYRINSFTVYEDADVPMIDGLTHWLLVESTALLTMEGELIADT